MPAGKPELAEKSLTGARVGWVVWFCLLVLSAFIVPFTLLRNVVSAAGAFLYWTVFALVAMVSIVGVMRRWRD
ncbi:MAG: hypothetical protein QHH27_10585 [Clostridia bacterium]|jgi:membrane protein YdbS with pleckstrin-like domain|nr:hypothetical protein [Clostridia bacterium]MDH7573969.1 hypothetical protein [Clostridia bacterium]